MSPDDEHALEVSAAWMAFLEAIDEASDRPNKARFETVGRRAMAWSNICGGIQRVRTCVSNSEPTTYVESSDPKATEPRLVHYTGSDTPHNPGDTVLATPDELQGIVIDEDVVG